MAAVNILISSLVLSIAILSALAIKWEIKIKIAVFGGALIGFLTAFFLLALHVFSGWFNWLWFVVFELAIILFMTLLFIVIAFYRDPERSCPQKTGIILSPADGTVLYVKTVRKGKVPFSSKNSRKIQLKELARTSLLADTSYLVGIGMNLLNVHVNRAPIEGKVIQLKHTKGSFASLKKFDALLQNERFTTVIDNGSFKVGVVQIASRLVRRIVSFLDNGDTVQIGQRIGMIKFGSQVDLVFPKLQNIKIEVEPGCEVVAGESVIATHSLQSDNTKDMNCVNES